MAVCMAVFLRLKVPVTPLACIAKSRNRLASPLVAVLSPALEKNVFKLSKLFIAVVSLLSLVDSVPSCCCCKPTSLNRLKVAADAVGPVAEIMLRSTESNPTAVPSPCRAPAVLVVESYLVKLFKLPTKLLYAS